ncbi:toxin-antitoxin system HicB family antitoxin [Citrobacter werkmanii]|uniref:toxin-antitoxin system HicB family antitoxin n=1 Tax=Citrobacter werkmanii TaxID=67827 RepID=UPI0026596909|nr:toxin-antitoxin system HicB family antitoxin [Citrobacter werkmanii]
MQESMSAGKAVFMISILADREAGAIMAKKTQPKLNPVETRPLNVTTALHEGGRVKPIQIRIDPALHREIKACAAEQGKSITALLLEAYRLYRQLHK